MKCKIFNRLSRARDTAKSSITHERRRRTRASERNLFSNPIPTWEIGVSRFQRAPIKRDRHQNRSPARFQASAVATAIFVLFPNKRNKPVYPNKQQLHD